MLTTRVVRVVSLTSNTSNRVAKGKARKNIKTTEPDRVSLGHVIVDVIETDVRQTPQPAIAASTSVDGTSAAVRSSKNTTPCSASVGAVQRAPAMPRRWDGRHCRHADITQMLVRDIAPYRSIASLPRSSPAHSAHTLPLIPHSLRPHTPTYPKVTFFFNPRKRAMEVLRTPLGDRPSWTPTLPQDDVLLITHQAYVWSSTYHHHDHRHHRHRHHYHRHHYPQHRDGGEPKALEGRRRMFLLGQIHVDTQSGMLTEPQCQHLRSVIFRHPTRSAASIAEVAAAFVASNRKMGLMNLPRRVADVLRSRMLAWLLQLMIGRARGLRSVCRHFRQWANGQGETANGEGGVFSLRPSVRGDMDAAIAARRSRFARAIDLQVVRGVGDGWWF